MENDWDNFALNGVCISLFLLLILFLKRKEGAELLLSWQGNYLLEVKVTQELWRPVAEIRIFTAFAITCQKRSAFVVPNFLLTETLPPQREFSPPQWAAVFYKSMIEIVCDNRHSNWAAHNDKRAKNRLNTIYKSLKWQGLQESVKQ